MEKFSTFRNLSAYLFKLLRCTEFTKLQVNNVNLKVLIFDLNLLLRTQKFLRYLFQEMQKFLVKEKRKRERKKGRGRLHIRKK